MREAFAGGLSWPLSPDEYYLPAGPARPVMQGDVFDDVPFTKARRGSKVGDPPNVISARRMVAVLGYPCDIYSAGQLVKVQCVAPVVNAAKVGIPPNWDGAFTMAPLPDLLGDGQMYAVDLRACSNIDSFYLNPQSRKRCLSELGWAAFRQRLGLASTRLLNHIDDLAAVGAELWQEMALWQRWNETGRSPAAFQHWLDQSEANLGGFSRRAVLGRGMYTAVNSSLDAEFR